MKILVLGGTGSVGSAVVAELLAGGHEVTALARSDRSAGMLSADGAAVLRGDLREPAGWVPTLPPLDGIVHAATDFAEDLAEVDGGLLDALLPALGAMPGRPALIYTGGCWLYGTTGGQVATEASPFNPLPAFAGTVPCIERVLSATGIRGMVVHPALVYDERGGVLSQFTEAAEAGHTIEVIGGADISWPMVHAADLAALYRLMLERGAAGSSYIGVGEQGVNSASIAKAIRERAGSSGGVTFISADDAAATRGEWARGYALDQRLSGEKARRELGWMPRHTDLLGELAR